MKYNKCKHCQTRHIEIPCKTFLVCDPDTISQLHDTLCPVSITIRSNEGYSEISLNGPPMDCPKVVRWWSGYRGDLSWI